MAEGAILKPQREEKLVGCSLLGRQIAGLKIVKRERRSIVREFFLNRLSTKKSIFLLVEQQQ